MSTRPLVFEGPDPERLLLEAWSVHGTSVRISEPVTVHSGGVLGFFAKLRYRIEVLPDPEPPRAAVRAVPADSPAAALEALVEQTEDLVDLDTARPDSFDAVLERVASSLGTEPAEELAVLSAGATHSAAEALGESRPAEPAPLPRVDRDALPAGSPIGTASEPPTPHVPLDHLSAPALAPGPGVLPASAAGDAAVRGDLTAAGFPTAVLEAIGGELASPAEAFAALPAPRPLPVTPGSLVAVVGAASSAAAIARVIAAELGVEQREVAWALPRRASHLQQRPELLPEGPGAPTGGLADPLGRGCEARLVARDPRAAADLSPGWRRDRVGVVVVVVPPSDQVGGERWTRSMLAALAPSMTLAVASAAAKAEDVAARWAAAGGVDGLLLEDLGATLTPATALASGVPVARLDGAPATPAAWAAAVEQALERRKRGW